MRITKIWKYNVNNKKKNNNIKNEISIKIEIIKNII